MPPRALRATTDVQATEATETMEGVEEYGTVTVVTMGEIDMAAEVEVVVANLGKQRRQCQAVAGLMAETDRLLEVVQVMDGKRPAHEHTSQYFDGWPGT